MSERVIPGRLPSASNLPIGESEIPAYTQAAKNLQGRGETSYAVKDSTVITVSSDPYAVADLYNEAERLKAAGLRG